MFNEWEIRGWVISTENVMAPVGLDFFLCGINITSTTSRYSRTDIDRIVGLPVRAGFRISASAISTEAAVRVFEALKRLADVPQPIDKILSVRIAGTDLCLPFTGKLRSEMINVGSLLPVLDAIIGTRARSEYISVRDQLISAPAASDTDAVGVKPIAFYLPQFHPFPENNEWWGEGFTEWTNVVGAKSVFPGHYQPHVPADFGYYDLRVEDIQRQQIDLAKRYGIEGFCYYYYWFSGKKLMTMPIDRHVEKSLDMDFCLCWANENWSRRWDGSESDVLIAQRHVEEDDVEFIRSCIKFFKSERYIKIDGAPLLLVYRVSLLQNPEATVARWRKIVKSHGFPDLHVSMVESFGLTDPNSYGCDSSCQFPPHGVVVPEITTKVEGLDPAYRGKIYDYREVVRSEIARPIPDYMQFRCAMPSWDNTSRKGKDGNVFAYSSPDLFEVWLGYLCSQARENLPPASRFVFINAWNEWAEGAHLEPDAQNGHAFLASVRSALTHDSGIVASLQSLPEDDKVGTINVGEIKKLIGKLRNANQQMQRLIKNYDGAIGDRPSPFVPIKNQWFEVVSGGPDDRAWLDNINGRPSHDTKLELLSKQQTLSLRGWIHCPTILLSPSFPVFVSLSENAPEGQRYFAKIYDRQRREDIVNSLGLTESSVWCGFSIKSALNGVKPGRYRLDFMLSQAGKIKDIIIVPSHVELVVS
ncbi:glycoside hydrolase family 99-like domain-containing protein [Sphingobium naphthae]|nr:glycoside hydrolase family 99-like domain-containing protein [Sphingobium naphthae]